METISGGVKVDVLIVHLKTTVSILFVGYVTSKSFVCYSILIIF